MKRPSLLLFAIGLLLSCPRRADPLRDARAVVQERMHQRLATVEEARLAVMRGDLERAKAAGWKLQHLGPVPDPPSDWVPRLSALEQSARALAEATDLRTAAASLGTIGAVCGECHHALGTGPLVPPGRVGETDMQRHGIHMEGMWIALVAHDEAAFQRSARALGEGGRYYEHDTPFEMFVRLDDRVHDLALRGETAPFEAQARLVGEMLVTCAVCHSAFGGGPPPAG